MTLSSTEENYIKIIYQLEEKNNHAISTNQIAEQFQKTPASVTDMMKKLKEKDILTYEKYKGVKLTKSGLICAKNLIRRHRLWEVFLSKNLAFGWEEVHEIAEELEHISSQILIEKLDTYLGYPKLDPHGDPIPDAKGNIRISKAIPLSEYQVMKMCKVVSVTEQSKVFLKELSSMDIQPGNVFMIKHRNDFDGSLVLLKQNKKSIFVSEKMASHILVVAEKNKN